MFLFEWGKPRVNMVKSCHKICSLTYMIKYLYANGGFSDFFTYFCKYLFENRFSVMPGGAKSEYFPRRITGSLWLRDDGRKEI